MFFSKDKDSFFRILDMLEIGNSFYYLKESNYDFFNMYPVEERKILNKPVVKKLKKVVVASSDDVYCLNESNRIKKVNLLTKTEEVIFDKEVNAESVYVYGSRVFFLAEITINHYELCEFNSNTGLVNIVVDSVKKILSVNDNKIIYTVSRYNKSSSSYDELMNIINIDTFDVIEFGTKKVSVEGFTDNAVIYTQASPNDLNKNLYIKSFGADEPERLLEQNIYKFCDIMGDRIFYTVGNSKNKCLVSIKQGGIERKEYSCYADKILFEHNGWLYCISEVEGKTVLYKFFIDGDELCVISGNIKEFVCTENGYIYYTEYADEYVDSISALIKTNIDDVESKENLWHGVETVLYLNEDRIICIANDEAIKLDEYSQETRIVKSIYSIDFSTNKRIKLVYDVKAAKVYDNNTIYYVAPERITFSYDKLCIKKEVLYKLDIKTNESTYLIDLEFEEKNEGCYIATCVYGSYNCPQVLTLRHFRDNTLARTLLGRSFIRTYYTISPTIVKWFGNTYWFKKIWRGLLDRIVSKLQAAEIKDITHETK